MAKDPVCGMDVDNSNYTSRHNGQDVCFCSPGCKNEFDRGPERFRSASGPNPEGTGPQGQRGGSAHPMGRAGQRDARKPKSGENKTGEKKYGT